MVNLILIKPGLFINRGTMLIPGFCCNLIRYAQIEPNLFWGIHFCYKDSRQDKCPHETLLVILFDFTRRLLFIDQLFYFSYNK